MITWPKRGQSEYQYTMTSWLVQRWVYDPTWANESLPQVLCYLFLIGTFRKEIFSFQRMEGKSGIALGIFATTSGKPTRQCSDTEPRDSWLHLLCTWNLGASIPCTFPFTWVSKFSFLFCLSQLYFFHLQPWILTNALTIIGQTAREIFQSSLVLSLWFSHWTRNIT